MPTVHRKEFSYESTAERILKIGPHLSKLLLNIKGHTFLRQCIQVACSGQSAALLLVNRSADDNCMASALHLHLHLFRSKNNNKYNKVTKEQDNKAYGML